MRTLFESVPEPLHGSDQLVRIKLEIETSNLHDIFNCECFYDRQWNR